MQKETIVVSASAYKGRRFAIPPAQLHRDRKRAEKACRGQKHKALRDY